MNEEVGQRNKDNRPMEAKNIERIIRSASAK